MSFDLFFGGCKDGRQASLPRDQMEQHFGHYVSHRGPQGLTLDFGNGETCDLYCGDDDHIDFFSINRPVGDGRLFEAILDLLRSQPWVLFMPGQCPPLVGSAAIVPHVPADMIEANGPPVVVTSADEILRWIQQA